MIDNINNVIIRRFPPKTEIRSVFGLVVFFVYSWAIYKFIFEVPSLILNTPWEKLGLDFLTLMAAALFESLLITIGFTFLCLILPAKWFKDGFIYKSFVTLVSLTGFILWIRRVFIRDDTFPPINTLYQGVLIFFILWVGLLILVNYIKPVQNILRFIGDRIEVFLYLYVPLGIVGFAVTLLLGVIL